MQRAVLRPLEFLGCWHLRGAFHLQIFALTKKIDSKVIPVLSSFFPTRRTSQFGFGQYHWKSCSFSAYIFMCSLVACVYRETATDNVSASVTDLRLRIEPLIDWLIDWLQSTQRVKKVNLHSAICGCEEEPAKHRGKIFCYFPFFLFWKFRK